jgi:hypothetical protein
MLSNGGEKMGKESGKTGQVTLGVWYDEEAGDIHLSIPGHGLSTVNGNAASKRGNPHLFNKLAKALRDQGKPHPVIVEEWDRGLGN